MVSNGTNGQEPRLDELFDPDVAEATSAQRREESEGINPVVLVADRIKMLPLEVQVKIIRRDFRKSDYAMTENGDIYDVPNTGEENWELYLQYERDRGATDENVETNAEDRMQSHRADGWTLGRAADGTIKEFKPSQWLAYENVIDLSIQNMLSEGKIKLDENGDITINNFLITDKDTYQLPSSDKEVVEWAREKYHCWTNWTARRKLDKIREEGKGLRIDLGSLFQSIEEYAESKTPAEKPEAPVSVAEEPAPVAEKTEKKYIQEAPRSLPRVMIPPAISNVRAAGDDVINYMNPGAENPNPATPPAQGGNGNNKSFRDKSRKLEEILTGRKPQAAGCKPFAVPKDSPKAVAAKTLIGLLSIGRDYASGVLAPAAYITAKRIFQQNHIQNPVKPANKAIGLGVATTLAGLALLNYFGFQEHASPALRYLAEGTDVLVGVGQVLSAGYERVYDALHPEWVKTKRRMNSRP